MKTKLYNQISLEERLLTGDEKVNERDKRLQESYDKMMKMYNEVSFLNAEKERLIRVTKEKEKQL